MATNCSNMANEGLLPYDEGYAKAREVTEAASAIDSEFASAHGSLGWISMIYDSDLAQAAHHFNHALQLEPMNITIISNASALLLVLGRLEQAIATYEYTSKRDPISAIKHSNLGFCYLNAGRWDEAITSYETTLRLSPSNISANYYIGIALLGKGDFPAALELFNQAEDEAYRVKGQAMALYSLGRQEEHQARLDELIERWGDQWPEEVAHVYAWMDDTDRAFAWLNKGLQDSGFIDITQPLLQSLNNDPRWVTLLASFGQSPEQLSTIEFEIKLP